MLKGYLHIPANLEHGCFMYFSAATGEDSWEDFNKMKSIMEIRVAERLPAFNELESLEMIEKSPIVREPPKVNEYTGINFWFDEEALMYSSPKLNVRASVLAQTLCNSNRRDWLEGTYFGNACVEVWCSDLQHFYDLRRFFFSILEEMEYALCTGPHGDSKPLQTAE